MESRHTKVISRDGGRHRSVPIAVLAAAMLLFGVGVNAEAATDARVTGSFDASVKILTGDGAGTKVERTYRFKPLCRKGVCNKVKFFRESAGGDTIKSILTRKRRGTYKGKKSFPVTCTASGKKGTFTEKHWFEVVKATKGKAVKLEGKSSYRSVGPGCDVDQTNRWVAK